MNKKRIVFLTGTRADFGKLKSLISISQKTDNFEVHIFATGMHMNSKYGRTVDEIIKYDFKNVYQFINHDTVEHMDRTLAKTIDGFSHFITEIKPDLIVVHGDRVEALAGAIVGSLNNILVSHIEGGEISGTVDELIRHAVSKMSHIHFVANEEAKGRLIQLGEYETSIFVIGSPDLDLMNPNTLPLLDNVKNYYNIEFEEYSIAIFHPVTTEYNNIQEYAKNFIKALVTSKKNYVVIYPNNDIGSNEIINELAKIANNTKFKIFPSVRVEYFLSLLKNAEFIIGNSSAGIREAPYYNVPTIDIGTRQLNRVSLPTIIHSEYHSESILSSINQVCKLVSNKVNYTSYFGEGKSDELFLELIKADNVWNINHQKQFQEIKV